MPTCCTGETQHDVAVFWGCVWSYLVLRDACFGRLTPTQRLEPVLNNDFDLE